MHVNFRKQFKKYDLVNLNQGKGSLSISLLLISNSSVVEQMAVNHLVVGSNPTWGGYMELVIATYNLKCTNNVQYIMIAYYY